MAFPTESRLYTYTVYHGIAWFGMVFLAFALLTACSLLAGLTLALGGLDPTWLQLRSVAGTPRQRQQAIVVGKIKSHSTWMLCSLIISSVACGESLPFVIQSLWHGSQQWVPVLISTFTMALYAEILPQYLIPRQPIVWGYYCAPIIWGCMWLTGIVSYPLACLLDTIAGRSPGYSIFTRQEMAAVIKYHDLSENSHGTIGPDATRVMLGALNLDSRSIGGDIALVPETNTSVEKDVEKADPIVLQELLVHWSDVKTVDIDDVVDDKFMSRVNDWSYSCIPVLGKHEFHKVEMDPAIVEYRWEGRQLFGFLHIKSLLDVDIRDAIKSLDKIVTVRDILLCPLPIIPVDMPVYDILSVFQLGISRMAIVVPVALDASETQQKDGAASRKLLWTASETACTGSPHSASEHSPIGHAEDLNADPTLCQDQSISALKSPKPIGIVTYKDIVNAILQKPNPEESDFLNGCNMPPPRKCKNAVGRVKFACSYVQNRYGAPISRQKPIASRPSIPSTMRRRNVSTKLPESMEARTTNEVGELNNGVAGIETPVSAKYQNNNTEMTCVQKTANTRCGESQSVRRTESSTLTLTESLPSRKGFSAVLPNGAAPSWRHVSAAPRLPQVQRVTPFSRQGYSSYENIDEEHSISGGVGPSIYADSPSVGCGIQSVEGLETRKSELKIPQGSKCATIPEDFGGSCEDSQEAFSLVSWCPAGFVDVNEWNSHLQEPTTCTTRLETSCTSIPSSEALVPEEKPEILPYQGFPPELLTNTQKENRFPNRASNTLPRMIGQLIDLEAFSEKDDSPSPQQDESPHADRTLLPSQRRIANDSTVLAISGARSSSFWV